MTNEHRAARSHAACDDLVAAGRPATRRASKRTGMRAMQLAALAGASSLLLAMLSNGADASLLGARSVRGHAPQAVAAIHSGLASTGWTPKSHHPWHPPVTTTTVATTTTTTVAPTTTTTTTPPTGAAYPVGTPDATEPSGMAPPDPSALPGYSQSYVTDFTGSSLPSGWLPFTGQPGGDPGAQWASSHITVSGGMMQLNAWQDPAYGNEWVTGGTCQCGLARTYGAYFVRSRQTGPGPTVVQLLWPTAKVWPPEIDFNETDGTTSKTSATVHFTNATSFDQRRLSGIDMTQWHTWGVVWTANSVTYTVDGQVWGSVSIPSELPHQDMTLDITQQTWCSSGWGCPTSNQSTQVDWVAEYAPQ